MHIQIVTFRLQGLTDEEYVAGCADVAQVFATVPGLVSKVWLRDAATGTYGGIKAWTDRAAMEAYLEGDLWRSLAANPHYVSAVSRDFGVIEEPTRVTRGYPVVAA